MGEFLSKTQHPAHGTQDWLSYQATAGGDRAAVHAPGVNWTFAQLAAEAAKMSHWLQDQGVTPGDRVAALLSNGAPFVALVHACTQVDAVLVPLNTRLTPAELAWQLTDSGARLLLHDPPRAEAARVATGETGIPCHSLGEQEPGIGTQKAQNSELKILSSSLDLDAVQAIIYTSGTTGRPKGALLTYGNHWWSAVGSALNLGLRPDDRWLAPLPLFHVGGLAILWRSVIYGIPAVIHDQFDPTVVNRAIDEEGVTIVSVVSAMLARMLDARAGRPYPPTLRAVLLGGGPAPRPLLESAATLGVPVVQTYGLTEAASQVATLAPTDALRKLGSAGRPLLPTRIQVAGPDGPLPPGAVGEIRVQGPTVTPGYLNQPAATARALRDGWLHTGDLGYLDTEGYLYVVDRRADLIISGGENIYPAEVEAALLVHPAVAEAGVVGVPDARWGARVQAMVVPRPGSAPPAAELIAWCRGRLAGYKVPAEIAFVESLPRNAAGKMLRRALRAGSPEEQEAQP